jgi:hypothetical protein
MRYFLVLLSDSGAAVEPPDGDHERFIEELIARNLILLGGGFGEPAAGADGAYVLATDTRGEALELAHKDPLVLSGARDCTVVEWQLVGINTGALKP